MFEYPNYTYKVLEWSVVDGDTIDVTMDLGCHVRINRRLRLLDIDTDEMRGGTLETKERAKQAKQRIGELLSKGDVYVQTEMDSEGKYGRLLAYVWVVFKNINESCDNQYINVNNAMVEEGFQKGNTTIRLIY